MFRSQMRPVAFVSRACLLFLLVSVLQACAMPKPMPFSEEAPTLKAEEGPLYLMTATIKNVWAPSYQPDAMFVFFEKLGSAEPESISYAIAQPDYLDEGSEETGKSYFLRFQLQPGEYRLVGIRIAAGFFPVRGNGFMPVHADFTVKEGGPYYLGNLYGLNRERKDNEFRTGGVLPLIDQSVTGFSSGTFDVSVRDQFDQEIPAFKTRYPSLQDMTIEKSILEPIDRQRAQEIWEKAQ